MNWFKSQRKLLRDIEAMNSLLNYRSRVIKELDEAKRRESVEQLEYYCRRLENYKKDIERFEAEVIVLKDLIQEKNIVIDKLREKSNET